MTTKSSRTKATGTSRKKRPEQPKVIPAERAHGMITPDGVAVPMLGVAISGKLTGRAAEIRVAQRFRNVEAKPIEAVYLFPLPESAAVCGLEVRTGDLVLHGEVDEREAAFDRYDEAMSQGHGAVLLDQERPNVFQMNVGNLLPGQEAVVEVRFLLLADVEGQAVRLAIPTTVSPRYTPPSLSPEQLREIERTAPPYALAVPYGVSLEIDVEAGAPITVVDSPSHRLRTELDGNRARVTLSRGEEALDSDVVLKVETRKPHGARALVAERGGRDHLLVELLPSLPVASKTPSLPREIWFLIDCSGSMRDDSIDQARRAVELCLRTLRPGDRFQAARFGNTHEFLFDKPRVFSQEALEEAALRIRALKADLGGTEIMAPLEAIANAAAGQCIDLIVLTDGEVSNEAQVLAFLQQHRDRLRVFSFGIGAGASDFLVRGMARETGGRAEFIFPGERIEEKVLRQFGRIDAPRVDDITVDWAGREAVQAPALVPELFFGEPLLLSARLDEGAVLADGAVITLRGTTAAGPVSWAAHAVRVAEGEAVALLWARERIRDLEAGFGVPEGSRQKRGKGRTHTTLIALSKEYGVLCSETSFIVIEKRAAGERATETAELRRVPVALTMGWHGIGSVMPNIIDSSAEAVTAFNIRECRGGAMLALSPRDEKLLRMRFGIGTATDPTLQDAGQHFEATRERIRQKEGKAPPPPWHIALLMEQQADGSFALTNQLIEAARLSSCEARRLLNESGLEETVFATALAVVTLHRRAGAEGASWRAAVDKALDWLDRMGQKVVTPPCQWLETKLR